MAGGQSGYLGAAATVVLTILPLCAAAQTEEISWRPATPSKTEFAPRTLYFLPGELKRASELHPGAGGGGGSAWGPMKRHPYVR